MLAAAARQIIKEDKFMKRRIDLLTAMGALTLTSGLLALAALVLVWLADILEDRALAVIELLFCAMMIL